MAVRIETHAEPIPGYRLIERLGGGGFGDVWKAEAPGGLQKAIKFVFGDLRGAGENGQRAEQELKALKRVKEVRHPYILSLERYDIIDGQLIIVMELADRNLWDRFKECRAQGLPGIPRDELLGYMTESAEALDLMNTQYQLQHLDIKPQNLFLVYQHIKVADFGLVKDLEGMQASVTGGVTPVYAAPETFDGWVSRYCDQYSLAIVYQELLTGQRPFTGINVRQLILQHLQAAPNVTPLPPTDQPIIARSLAKTPDERYPTCREMVEALRESSLSVAGQPRPTPRAGHSSQGPERTECVPPPSPLRPLDNQDTDKDESENVRTASIRPRQGEAGGTRFIRTLEAAIIPQAPCLAEPQAQGADALRSDPAPPEVVGDGTLFPALVIGLGQMGMSVLQRLGDALHTHFGNRDNLPHLRLLLLDTDPEILRAANRGPRPGQSPRGGLAGNDVLLTPLNRPSYYLKPREGRPPINAWLNPRMLYRIPRSQLTTGVRALGRLAFCDHYRNVVRRLQADLQACLDPEALATASQQTGLGLRTSRPRVYVVTSLAGGTGSGIFLDVAYTVRALLKKMGYEHPDVVGLLLLPPVDGNRTRVLALGNTYAALSELQYFATPGTQFSARYVEREPAVQDPDPPFSRSVLLPLPEETDEAGTRALTDLAGQFLFRDLTSPLGRTADVGREALSALRRDSRGLFFQTFGLSQLSWPRHAILKAASRALCQRIVQRWSSKDSKPVREAVQTWVQEQWAQHGLGADQFIYRLQEACQEALGHAPEKAFAAIVENLAKQPEAVGAAAERGGRRSGRGAKSAEPEVTPEEVAAALEGFEQLIGKPGEENAETGGSVVALLRQASDKLMQAWGQKMAELPVRLIEEPRFRLAGAEEAIRQVMASIEQILQHYEPLGRDLTTRAAEAYLRLQAAMAARQPGKPSRAALPAPDVLELLRNYPKWRYQSLVLQQVAGAFVSLRGHLSDELREINFCRVRLSELLRILEEPDADAPADRDGDKKGVGRRLYPTGCKNLQESVDQFLAGVGPEDLVELDLKMEMMLKKQFTALVNVCLTNSPILKTVERYMLTTAYEFAALRGTETSVAELFLQQNADAEQAAKEAGAFFREAAAKLSPAAAAEPSPGVELCILATPPGEAGDKFRDLVHAALPEAPLQDCCSATADDILIYREHPTVPLTALEHFGALGEDAYRQMTSTEHFTPHSRIDIPFRKK